MRGRSLTGAVLSAAGVLLMTASGAGRVGHLRGRELDLGRALLVVGRERYGVRRAPWDVERRPLLARRFELHDELRRHDGESADDVPLRRRREALRVGERSLLPDIGRDAQAQQLQVAAYSRSAR